MRYARAQDGSGVARNIRREPQATPIVRALEFERAIAERSDAIGLGFARLQ